MTAALAFNVTTGVWLQYAIMSIASHLVTALPILLCTFALLYFVFGMLWGKCWNKRWFLSASPNRWLWVGVAALVAAGSITCADSLYGGNFFRTAVAQEIKSLPSGDSDIDASQISAEEAPNAKPVVESLVKTIMPEDETDHVYINQAFADAYASALTLLWGLFGTCIILLIGGVALAAVADIKEVKPL